MSANVTVPKWSVGRWLACAVVCMAGAAGLLWLLGLTDGKAGPGAPEFVIAFSVITGVLGVVVGAALSFAIFRRVNGWVRNLATAAVFVLCMSEIQSAIEVASSVVVLARGSSAKSEVWRLATLLITIATTFGVGAWCSRRLKDVDRLEFAARMLWVLLCGATLLLVASWGLCWVFDRNWNPRLGIGPSASYFMSIIPLIGCSIAILRTRRFVWEMRLLTAGACRTCGYDMTAVESATRCPECGAAWTPQ